MARTKTREQIYEQKAQRILRYLKHDKRYSGYLPRPFVIEMTGSPDAGKSTSIDEIYKFFHRLDFRVGTPKEGAQEIQHIGRSTYEYNVRTGTYALNILLDETNRNNYDIVILDRGIYDAYCWMMYWHQKGQLTEEQMRQKQAFFLDPLWKDRTDIAYFVVCDPQVAIARDQEVSVSSRMGNSTNPESIRKTVLRHQAAYEQLAPTNPQLKLVDTSRMAKGDMIEYFTSTTLDALERKIQADKK